MLAIMPSVVSCHTINASSLATVVSALIKPGMTSEQKAQAIWAYCWQHTFHWVAPREGSRAHHELDVVYDAIKQLNVYGYTYCFAIRSLAEALYEAAGLEARSGGIGGHVIAEVYYDGRYHYLDHDQRGFTRLDDGTIASLKDYRDCPEQLLNPPGRSEPCFPASTRPWAPYEQRLIFAGYLTSQSHHYRQHDKYRATHSMAWALRPGERFTRNWDSAGKWHWSPGWTDGYMDPVAGPRDPYHGLHKNAPRGESGGARASGNGLLLYRPNLMPGSRDFEDGIYSARNIRRGGHGFGPRQVNVPAYAEFRVRLPYIIVGRPLAVDKPDCKGAAVISGRYRQRTIKDCVRLDVSTNEGATWKTAWRAKAVGESDFAVDLSRYVAGGYSYRVRMVLQATKAPGDARILAFGMDTACQLNPAVLPAVRPGHNRMTVSLDPGTDIYEERIQYGERGLTTHKRFCRAMTGLRIHKASVPRLEPVKRGRSGYVIYEVTAPPGKMIAWIKAGGAFRSSTPPKYGEQFRMAFSLGQRHWIPLWEADLPPYLGHWCFEAERDIPLAKPVRTLRIRYALQRAMDADSKGGSLVEVRLAWGCRSAKPAPSAGPVQITHAWREGQIEKQRRQSVAGVGKTYRFNVKANTVVNRFIAVEWEKRPPVDDTPHRLMTAAHPGIPPDAERDHGRAQMRAELARLDRQPTLATVLDLMEHSPHPWVRGGMAAALIALRGSAAERARRACAARGDRRVTDYLDQRRFDHGSVAALTRALTEVSVPVRLRAARALARRPARQAGPALRRTLDQEQDASVLAAATAAWILSVPAAALPNPLPIPECCDQDGRREIAAALAKIGRAEAWPLLEQTAADPDPGLRYRAARDLGASGRAEAEAILIRLLEDSSRWVRQAATAGLARCGGRAAGKALRRMARRDPEPYLRAEANWARHCCQPH